MAAALCTSRLAGSRVCRICGTAYAGAYRGHLDATGHARSRSSRQTDEAFLTSVRQHPDRTIANVGAEYGLRREAAKRAAAKAGIFRRGRRTVSVVRDRAVVLRSREGVTRRQLADEFGLSLSHIYYILRLDRTGHERAIR